MKRTLKSFGFAGRGLATAFRDQKNLKIQLGIALLVGVGGIRLGISATEWGVLSLCCGLVLSLEMMNTAIEYLVDFVSPQQHPLAGKIKDIAAGSVLMAACFAALAGVFIFGPYLVAAMQR